MKANTKRIFAIALTLLLILALSMPALAATKRMITNQSAVVRSSPTQSANNIIGNLARNTQVIQTGSTGAWAIIEFQGSVGYVLSSQLSTYAGVDPEDIIPYEGGSATAVTEYATGTVNVRSGPGTNYSIMDKLGKGDPVSKVGSTGEWSIIQWGNSVAYVSSNYLTSSGSGSGSGSSTSGDTMKATANVNVRSGPSTKYSIVGWLAKGETIRKTGSSGNWTKVAYNNGTAYVSSSYLTPVAGPVLPDKPSSYTTLVARVDTTVRTGPSSSNRAIGYLDAGQYVKFLDTYGAWYRIEFGSHTNAYVYAADMRVESGSTGSIINATGYVYASNSVRVYSSASTSSSTLGYLYAGDYAPRTGTQGNFTRIDFNGKTGFVATSQIAISQSGAGSMSPIRNWMYSRYAKVACYTTPVESNSYLHGYLGINEAVWAVEGNGTWTKIETGNGYIVYTRTSNLTYSSGSGSSGSTSKPNGFAFSAVASYKEAALTTPYRTIPANTDLQVITYWDGFTYAEVRWYEGNTMYQGFVKASNIFMW